MTPELPWFEPPETVLSGSIPIRLDLGLENPPIVNADLSSYDAIVVALSGGKDSLAALIAILEALHGLSNRPQVFAVHADLGDVEWPGVSRVVTAQAKHFGVETMIVRRHGRAVKRSSSTYRAGERYGDIVHHMKRNRHMFRQDTRACTSEHKRGPIGTAITAIANQLRVGKEQVRILNVMGIRAAEGRRRSKLKSFYRDNRFTTGRKLVDVLFPIFDWGQNAVWRAIWRTGVPWPWAYDAGVPRLSCPFCVFSTPAAWRVAAYCLPRLANRYFELEITLEETLGRKHAVGDIVCEIDGLDPIEMSRQFGNERISAWED